uniref:E3 UFM1-protein ligase 1 homolog n=1 Tax=Acrobeloides nanus TaxID=290746 RepID=A0A914DF27_9BILA
MTTWADIQRLASDLQRVQLAEGAKKLSENNVIEVVSKLISMNSIDIIFTNDGREYITRKHLLTEVRNECIAADGRLALTDLATRLNVSLNHVENAVATITKADSFVLCAGELLSKEFLDSLFKRLNERLKEVGHLSVRNLTKSWDLPMEILNEFVLPELGRKVEAIKDEDELYTYQF